MSTAKENVSMESTRTLERVRPLADIYENDDEILVFADMPGVSRDAININLENGKLALTAVRRLQPAGALNYEEFGDLEYSRTFSVPQGIDAERVNAQFKDGILRLHLPKSEAVKPRQIEVCAG